MQVSVETLDGLSRKLMITVNSDVLEAESAKRLKKLGKEVKIQGFRPGKVPEKVVRQHYGKSAHQEAINDVIQQTLPKAFDEAKLQPAGYPSIEVTKSMAGQPLEYAATFEVFPTVELQNHKKMPIEKISASVTDKDMEEMLTKVREQQKTWATVERAAQKDDQAILDFATKIDGEPLEKGGDATDFKIVLGSGQMIPGFEDGILTHKAGDEFTMNLSFPDDYHAKDLAGKAAEFTITMKEVQEPALPELNDEFAKSFGDKIDSMDALQKELRKNMERDLNNALDSKLKEGIFETMAKAYDFLLPASMVKQEIEQLKQQMMQQFQMGQQGKMPAMDLPDNLFTEQAERRVRLGLVLSEFVKKNELKADKDAVKAKIDEMAKSYDDPEEVVKWYYGNQERLQQVEATVIEGKIVEELIENGAITEKQLSYQEVMNPKKEEAAAEK